MGTLKYLTTLKSDHKSSHDNLLMCIMLSLCLHENETIIKKHLPKTIVIFTYLKL